jgi:hypothetical protein
MLYPSIFARVELPNTGIVGVSLWQTLGRTHTPPENQNQRCNNTRRVLLH